MKKNLKIFSLIFVLSLSFIFTSCNKSEIEKEPWTIFVYMCGSNLESKNSAASKNLLEMISEDLPEGVNLIVEAGGAKKWDNDYMDSEKLNRVIIKNEEIKKVEKIEQSNMGDSKTFEDYLKWGIENYPANNYGLVFWDHGNGILGGVCNDENYSFDGLELPEMEAGLKTFNKLTNQKFEFIGFDACLMSNFSTAGILSNYANYMFASEEIEPSGGWNYTYLISYYVDNFYEGVDGRNLGIKICDGYYQKSLSSKRSDIATMACLDLSKFDELNNEFTNVCNNLIEMSETPEGLKEIAYGAKNSVKFGGSTEAEGYSNLIDLGSFIDGIYELKDKDKFLNILNEVVVYHKSGSQKLYSKGLSIYYPLNVDEDELEEYFELCVNEKYIEFLKNTFLNIPTQTIKFLDRGSINSNNEFQIEISEESKNYLLAVDFALIEYNLDDSTEKLSLVKLGFDNDIWNDENKYKSNLRGIWLALNGYKLYNTIVESNSDYIMFDAPIRINGKDSNLRYSFIFDDNYIENGYYKLLGAWDGIDSETGVNNKNFIDLSKEDIIEVYYPYKLISVSSNGNVVMSDEMYKYDVVELDYNEQFDIVEDGLDGEAYLYQYVVTDIYGKKYYSDAVMMNMKETRNQINNRKKLNGIYAAVPGVIINTKNKFVFDNDFIETTQEFDEFIKLIKKYRKVNKNNIGITDMIKF